MRRVALATSRQAPALTDDDRLAARALRERGVVNEPYLFLSSSPDAPARFADAILCILSG